LIGILAAGGIAVLVAASRGTESGDDLGRLGGFQSYFDELQSDPPPVDFSKVPNPYPTAIIAVKPPGSERTGTDGTLALPLSSVTVTLPATWNVVERSDADGTTRTVLVRDNQYTRVGPDGRALPIGAVEIVESTDPGSIPPEERRTGTLGGTNVSRAETLIPENENQQSVEKRVVIGFPLNGKYVTVTYSFLGTYKTVLSREEEALDIIRSLLGTVQNNTGSAIPVDPSGPKKVEIAPVGATTATITWDAPAGRTFTVEYGARPTALTVRSTATGDGTRYRAQLARLTPSSTYYFAVTSGGKRYENGSVPWMFTTKASDSDDSVSVSPTVRAAPSGALPSGQAEVSDGYTRNTVTADGLRYAIDLPEGIAITKIPSGHAFKWEWDPATNSTLVNAHSYLILVRNLSVSDAAAMVSVFESSRKGMYTESTMTIDGMTVPVKRALELAGAGAAQSTYFTLVTRPVDDRVLLIEGSFVSAPSYPDFESAMLEIIASIDPE
jgi:hypothetical protein